MFYILRRESAEAAAEAAAAQGTGRGRGDAAAAAAAAAAEAAERKIEGLYKEGISKCMDILSNKDNKKRKIKEDISLEKEKHREKLNLMKNTVLAALAMDRKTISRPLTEGQLTPRPDTDDHLIHLIQLNHLPAHKVDNSFHILN